MGIIMKQDFWISILEMVVLQRTWDLDWGAVVKSYTARIAEIAADVLIRFYGGIKDIRKFTSPLTPP